MKVSSFHGWVPTTTLPKGWMWMEAVPSSSIWVDGINITGPGPAFLALQFFSPGITFMLFNFDNYN